MQERGALSRDMCAQDEHPQGTTRLTHYNMVHTEKQFAARILFPQNVHQLKIVNLWTIEKFLELCHFEFSADSLVYFPSQLFLHIFVTCNIEQRSQME